MASNPVRRTVSQTMRRTAKYNKEITVLTSTDERLKICTRKREASTSLKTAEARKCEEKAARDSAAGRHSDGHPGSEEPQQES